jgi:hypothetical protein
MEANGDQNKQLWKLTTKTSMSQFAKQAWASFFSQRRRKSQKSIKRIQTDLKLGGELKTPRIRCTLKISSIRATWKTSLSLFSKLAWVSLRRFQHNSLQEKFKINSNELQNSQNFAPGLPWALEVIPQWSSPRSQGINADPKIHQKGWGFLNFSSKWDLSACEEYAQTTWQRRSSEVLARIHPLKSLSNLQEIEIHQKCKGREGERERARARERERNQIDYRHKILETWFRGMIALFEDQQGLSYRGKITQTVESLTRLRISTTHSRKLEARFGKLTQDAQMKA